jgi:aminoglycoside phosphotransferase (APT) family kinase protein
MRHTCEQIAAALAADHGITASVVDLTDRAGGFDNELFRATCTATAGAAPGWPEKVIVRVAHRAAALPTVERVASVHTWCVSHGYPVPPALGCGALDQSHAYFVMPFLKTAPAIASLARPWRWRPFIRTFTDLHLMLHDLPPDDFPGRATSVEEVFTEMSAAAAGIPSAAPMARWLEQHRHEAGDREDEVVCHFDYHPFNLLWKWGNPPLVIDWDTAGLGPRAADVAFTAELLALADMLIKPRPVGIVVGAVGRVLSRGYLERYLSSHPVDPEALRFWRVFQNVNVIVWSHGVTFLDTVIRDEANRNWSPRLEAIVEGRFRTLTGG